ncbi:hypothetical protein Poly51_19180 [Rubripirellula tenax]|uniref:Uncharacterized protein n=1 Tax=Rubripirellula tenax TaxID=2528015 RepID=A0A5C6FEE8_9BACT|nr:hypothetical protein Poly51_19180 [Rubripirellula tenax]
MLAKRGASRSIETLIPHVIPSGDKVALTSDGETYVWLAAGRPPINQFLGNSSS